MNEWDIKMGKAILLIQTMNAKKSRAITQKYVPSLQHHPSHPIHFEYIEGSSISVQHLLVLLIYCGMDQFQYKFSETFRRTKPKQILNDIIKIHSNFHHFAKYLKESIEVFGTEYKHGTIDRMYHGINQEMIFDSTAAQIFGPLSTTYDWDVAVSFSNNKGMVLELVPDAHLKYFDCEWVSPFSDEAELLFIGAFGQIQFLNITNTEFGFDYIEYVKGLRIIETMTDGMYFMDDPADIHKMIRNNTLNVSTLKLKPLSVSDKNLSLELLRSVLDRNRNDEHSNIEEVKDMKWKYIQNLLHQICLNKQRIWIN